MEKLIANRFEIQALLGRGGMGDVYRAKHPTFNCNVAVKILPKYLADNEAVAKSVMKAISKEPKARQKTAGDFVSEMISPLD